MTDFVPWPKTPRYYRDITITEKIDGTNACVVIEEYPFGHHSQAVSIPSTACALLLGPGKMDSDGFPAWEYLISAQSRKRFITPQADNYGFAKWVHDNAETLVRDLEAGRHYGEWWGQGIQRGYGMKEKRFSLFNTTKWAGCAFQTSQLHVVPHLYHGPHRENEIEQALKYLIDYGSVAADEPFKPAEGICIFHTASSRVYKVTLEDDGPKSQQPLTDAA